MTRSAKTPGCNLTESDLRTAERLVLAGGKKSPALGGVDPMPLGCQVEVVLEEAGDVGRRSPVFPRGRHELRGKRAEVKCKMVKDVSGREELLTVEDLAALLRVPRSWVYSHSQGLGAYKLGKYLRFSWSRVLERLEELEQSVPMLGQQPNDPISGPPNQGVRKAIEPICNK